MNPKSFVFILARSFLVICFIALTLPAFALQDGLLTVADSSVQNALAAQRNLTADLMHQPEVLGTAIGLEANGKPNLTIFVDRDSRNVGAVVQGLPQQAGNVPVHVELTDKFRAAVGRMEVGVTDGTPHTAQQTPPIQLGTSGGWGQDLANGFCCGGTLGSLVLINGEQHILSNYHVFEADIVPGGNGVVAMTGDAIIQPGLIDVNCNMNGAQAVATLVKESSLPNSNVDCSVAKVIPGQVASNGSILEIGTISSHTVVAALQQKVKKSGRTTGLTKSTITGLNATIRIVYENECAGGTAFTKTFTGQIVIKSPKKNPFISSGDSGSLMVESKAKKARAIGLLFAGSSTTAIAQPIDEVLAFLGATMVGQ